MHEIHIQLTEQLYNQAKRRALEAGFASLDEYILGVVTEDVAQETQDIDDRFTPKVVAHLNQIQEEIQTGAKTYSEKELDNYLQEKARVWRESPRKLSVLFSADSIRDLAEIWKWNANSRDERQADGYVNFLRAETRKLARFDSPGRLIPANSTLRYHTIKRRAGGYGHVVIFWIDGDILYVFRYFHTSQDWENQLEGNPESGEPKT